ncbi:MAG TPA: hypothetical protein VNM22_16210 [Candidatus Limnocylindrales bacterium]|nr:hypothetical protein [Candidatus Limnocylindrales bacterium]
MWVEDGEWRSGCSAFLIPRYLMGKISCSSVRIFVLITVSLTLLNSCGEPFGGNGNSQVFLTLTVGSGNPVNIVSDVFDPSVPGNVTDDFADFEITSVPKNSRATSPASDVILNQQNVTYFRPDGNPEVPAPFTRFIGNILVPAGGTVTQNLLVLPASAKLKPPLSDLAFGGGEGQIFLTAVIELFGEDLAGNPVSVKGTMGITARDVFP